MWTSKRHALSLLWQARVWLTVKLCEMCFVLSAWGDKHRKKLSASLGKAMFSSTFASALPAGSRELLTATARSWIALKKLSAVRQSQSDDSLRAFSESFRLNKSDFCSRSTASPPTNLYLTGLGSPPTTTDLPSRSETPSTLCEGTCSDLSPETYQSGTPIKIGSSVRGKPGTSDRQSRSQVSPPS